MFSLRSCPLKSSCQLSPSSRGDESFFVKCSVIKVFFASFKYFNSYFNILILILVWNCVTLDKISSWRIQLTFSSSKLTVVTPEIGVKFVQS